VSDDTRASALLQEGISALGLSEPAGAFARLEAYINELERANPRFGFMKYEDRAELVVKHVLDSLSAWGAIRDAAGPGPSTVLDVGSGAGFPGIPLAIALPGLTFTLLERMERRAVFLKTCVVLLGLSNAKAIRGDLVDLDGAYDVVTCRAFAPLERLVEDLGRSSVRWRKIVADKGREERVREEIEGVRRLTGGAIVAEVATVYSPFLDEQRRVVVLFSDPLLTNK
jgi:16S rRNA (guanine527-N7)-methyltransferase